MLAIFICVIKLKSVYYFGNVVAQWLDLKVCVLNSFIITIHVTSHIQYRSKVSYHRLARRVSFLARLVSRETRRVSFLASALEVPIRERIDHQTLTRFLFTLVNMRNDTLILKSRPTFYSNLGTSDTTL